MWIPMGFACLRTYSISIFFQPFKNHPQLVSRKKKQVAGWFVSWAVVANPCCRVLRSTRDPGWLCHFSAVCSFGEETCTEPSHGTFNFSPKAWVDIPLDRQATFLQEEFPSDIALTQFSKLTSYSLRLPTAEFGPTSPPTRSGHQTLSGVQLSFSAQSV